MQKNIKKPLGRRLLDFFLKTWIVASLCSFTSALYKKIAESLSCAIFTSYEKVSALLQKSTTAKTLAKNSAANAHPKDSFTLKIAKLYESSIFSAVISKIKWAFLNCQLNVLALFGITFGFTSALMLILENFAFSITKITFRGILNLINPLMTSLAFVIISILFMFSKKPLIRAVNESLFFSFVLFDFLSIRKVPSSDCEQYTGLNAGVVALLGILLGGIAIWVPPSTVAVILGVFIVFAVILHSPEAGVIGTLFALPFLPTMALVFLVCATALSLLLKCIRRKRILRFEGIDVLICVFGLFIMSGGVISVDIRSSVPKMLVFICFISIYFIVKNLIRTEGLILSCARSLAFSAMLVSAIGIAEYLLGAVSQTWQDAEMFSNIRGRAVSTFANPNVLGEYLILAIPVIFSMLLCSKTFANKMLFFSSYALCCICLVFTWSRGAWLGLVFATVVFVLIKSPKFLAGMILLLPAIGLAFSLFADTNILQRILSIGSTADSSTMYRWNIWQGVWRMLEDTGLYGIGIGTEAFSSVFPRYSLSGTEVAPHTHSLYLQIISETGIFSLVAFALICLSYFSLVFAYVRKTPGNTTRTLTIGPLCGVLAFLVQGFTDYVWYNYRVYLFFWLIFGIAMAVLNICKENDRRRYIYE